MTDNMLYSFDYFFCGTAVSTFAETVSILLHILLVSVARGAGTSEFLPLLLPHATNNIATKAISNVVLIMVCLFIIQLYLFQNIFSLLFQIPKILRFTKDLITTTTARAATRARALCQIVTVKESLYVLISNRSKFSFFLFHLLFFKGLHCLFYFF